MKNKFLNLNLLLLLFLCLVGFSPQFNRVIGTNMIVYATENTQGNESQESSDSSDSSELKDIVDKDFYSSLNSLIASENYSSILSGDDDGDDETSIDYAKNITKGVDMFASALSGISAVARTLATSLSVAVLSIIGFKIMNSGTGDVMTYIKQKKEISNAIICVLFITAIPYVAKNILEFNVPGNITQHVLSNQDDDSVVALDDIVATPKSALKDYIDNHKDIYSMNGNGSSYNMAGLPMMQNVDGETQLTAIGILKLVLDAVQAVIASIIYAPFLFVTSYAGIIGFFPVSLDAAMYVDGNGAASSIVDIAKTFFNTDSQSSITNIAIGALGPVAKGLGSITVVINLLYMVVKKFVILSIESVCYYYGFMHLMNKETDDVGKFLIRLIKGIIGITLFPHLLEFLLDVDGILSAAILRITGPAFPGLGILSTLPTASEANDGFTILFLSIVMCSIVFAMAKSFFIRRVEISFLYIASPAFFLKDMISSKNSSVTKLTSKCISSVFLTTFYAPIFALVNLMLAIGSSNQEIGLVYYLLVIAILWFGKDVITDIIREFAGSSIAASSASSQFAKGATSIQDKAYNYAEKSVKDVAGAAAYHGVKAVVDKDYRAEIAKRHTDNKKNHGKFLGSIKTATYDVGKGAFKLASNRAKTKFWTKYGAAAEKYDLGALDRQLDYAKERIDNRKILDEKHAITKEILGAETRNIVAQAESRNETIKKAKQEKHKRQIFNKALEAGSTSEEALKRVNDYEKMINNNKTHEDELNKAKIDKEKLVDKIISGKGHYSRETIKSAELYKSRLEMASKAKADQQVALLNGDIKEAEKLEKEYNEHMRIVNIAGNHLNDIDSISYAYRDNVKALNSAVKATDKRERKHGNVFNEALTLKEPNIVRHALVGLQNELKNDTTMQQEIQTILDKDEINNKDICGLIGKLERSNIDEGTIKNFSKGTMNFNTDAAINGMNIMAVSTVGKSLIPKSYNRTISGFANVDSSVLSSTIDDLKTRNGAAQIVNTYAKNGTVGSAEDILNMTSKLRSENVINEEEAVNIIRKTMGCTKTDASEVLTYSRFNNTLLESVDVDKFEGSMKTLLKPESNLKHEAMKELKTFRDEIAKGTCSNSKLVDMTNDLVVAGHINAKQAKDLLASSTGLNATQINDLYDVVNSKRVASDTSKFVADAIKSTDVDTNMLNYIRLNNTHSEKILEVKEDVSSQGHGNVTDYSDATFFRGKDIAIHQLNSLNNNGCFKGNSDANARLVQIQKDIADASPSDCKKMIKDFLVNEYSEGVVDKSQLILAAKTIFEFDENQARSNLNLAKQYSSDTNYLNEINTFNSNTSTNIMDYLNLTNGANSKHYSDAAAELLDSMSNNIGSSSLADNLKYLANGSSPIDFETIAETIQNTNKIDIIMDKRKNQVGKQNESIKEKNIKIEKINSESNVQIDSNRIINHKEDYDDAYKRKAKENNKTVNDLTKDEKDAARRNQDVENWEDLGLKNPLFYTRFQ